MKKHLLGLVLPIALLAAQTLTAATYTVTSLGDAGAGTLRNAIQAANLDAGSTVAFAVSGTIPLESPLPSITARTVIDGSTAPGYAGVPMVTVNFNARPGLNFAAGANSSSISALSLVGASSAAITLRASNVTVQGNYIGLHADGTVSGNTGDGVLILAPSSGNVVGNPNPVAGVTFANTSNATLFTVQPVSAWQGLRNFGSNATEYLICGSSGSNGLLYTGPIAGGGTSYLVQYTEPGNSTVSTSVYGPDNLEGGKLRLVGSCRKNDGVTSVYNYGFVWEGAPSDLPTGGNYTTIAYPGATYQYTHSTMGDLAVGNADGPKKVGNKTLPIGPGIAYIYDVTLGQFVTNIVFPKSKSTTAYGIWKNGVNKYTICGGYSPLATNNLTDQGVPLTQGKAYLVDYDSSTKKFSNWTSFEYPNAPAGVNFVTHFEGISSTEPGVYSLSADSVQSGSANPVQGSWVSVRRNNNGSFDKGTWVDLNDPADPDGIVSSNSVYGDQVVGIVAGNTTYSYQATLDIAFEVSNVISGNRGNGVTIFGSKGNIVSMNFIGTDPAGSANATFGNGGNGVFITAKSSANLIGGQAAGANNPTGSKVPANAVFQRPPLGNLISGNLGCGVLVNGASEENILSGNFIGTEASGNATLGNGLDGVAIVGANKNSLIGCTFYENPFVFYNVISGNRGNGLRIQNSNNVTVQANFLGIGADNATSVPNGGDGLLVCGTSKNTQVGGVIPLGNVISGNTLNGIEVCDKASDFISFNTFGGIAAFQPFASPNGQHGILITSTGRNNTVRTCIISGNIGNGIEIGGDASGVQITDTSVGTNTEISLAIPNQGTGIVISGTAHRNAIGGFQPSVEPNVFVSGNLEYGIAVIDQAYSNVIYHTTVGLGDVGSPELPNAYGGLLLDIGTSGTTVGASKAAFQNTIQSNEDAGVYIYYSKKNTLTANTINDNSVVGIYGYGTCTGTVLKANTVQSNGAGGTNNIDTSSATGIVVKP